MKELSSAQQEVAQLRKAAAIREVAHAAQLAALRTDSRQGLDPEVLPHPVHDVDISPPEGLSRSPLFRFSLYLSLSVPPSVCPSLCVSMSLSICLSIFLL